MRIITGKYKGRSLFTPSDDSVRPTSDRTRESLFNLLMHGAYGGAHVIDQPIADICCGTGALALEALSRGASRALLIDISADAIALARKNAAHLGALDDCQFVTTDATALPRAPFASKLVMIDMPYHSETLPTVVLSLAPKGYLATHALVVIEQAKFEKTLDLEDFTHLDTRDYGKCSLRVYQWDPNS